MTITVTNIRINEKTPCQTCGHYNDLQRCFSCKHYYKKSNVKKKIVYIIPKGDKNEVE